jgi:hypothetical protein
MFLKCIIDVWGVKHKATYNEIYLLKDLSTGASNKMRMQPNKGFQEF